MKTTSSIKTVGVVGTGVIGSSWIVLFLANGLRVIVSDPAPDAEKKLAAFITENWASMETLGLAKGASAKNYTFVEDVVDHLDEVDFVQENGPENVDFKTKLFARLDEGARPELVLASSSSGIPASRFLGKCTNAPGRVLIGHPFNPPHLVPLVEVVPHADTTDAAMETAMAFYTSLGKSPIAVKHETPGFIANRLQAALVYEAYSLVQRGVVSPQDLDKAVTTGLGLRWAFTGPFMTNVLAGGAGEGGFRHFLEHLGPQIQEWKRDMDAHVFRFGDQTEKDLAGKVGEAFSGLDVAELVKERDALLLELIKAKSGQPELV